MNRADWIVHFLNGTDWGLPNKGLLMEGNDYVFRGEVKSLFIVPREAVMAIETAPDDAESAGTDP